MDEVRRQQLIREVEVAFAESIYPGDDLGYEDEIGVFVGRNWRELSAEFVLSRSQDLFFFNVKGLCYFLPAFLIAWLRDTDRAQAYNLPSTLLSVLGPERPDLAGIAASLNSTQRTVVTKLLDSLAALASLSAVEQDALDDLRLRWWDIE